VGQEEPRRRVGVVQVVDDEELGAPFTGGVQERDDVLVQLGSGPVVVGRVQEATLVIPAHEGRNSDHFDPSSAARARLEA